MKIDELLSKLQRTVKVPKNQRNSFGNYNYRSCEDIVEALKPHLPEDATLLLNDEVVQIGTRYYIRATAKLTLGEEYRETTAYAREEESKKGMDSSQITGSASSYARKYALNGLLLIDDTKDSDAQDNRESKPAKVNNIKDEIKKSLKTLGYEPKTQAEASKIIVELTQLQFTENNYPAIQEKLVEIIFNQK